MVKLSVHVEDDQVYLVTSGGRRFLMDMSTFEVRLNHSDMVSLWSGDTMICEDEEIIVGGESISAMDIALPRAEQAVNALRC